LPFPVFLHPDRVNTISPVSNTACNFFIIILLVFPKEKSELYARRGFILLVFPKEKSELYARRGFILLVFPKEKSELYARRGFVLLVFPLLLQNSLLIFPLCNVIISFMQKNRRSVPKDTPPKTKSIY
jgi:hypothetical protein